jgi:phosphotransferase system enzyme I (PtsI)
MVKPEGQTIKLVGIAGSPGICIGKAYLVDTKSVNIVRKYYVYDALLAKEINRFKTAVKKSKDELDDIIKKMQADAGPHANIYETHLAMLQDKMLYGKTIEIIENDNVNAEWALKKVATDIKLMFENMQDLYLKERAADIEHVSDLIFKNLAGVEREKIEDIDRRIILVARDLSPAETSKINLERIKGFVTDRGGRESHTSIIARTLGIPAVLGLDQATRTIKSDDIIIVDGVSGVVIVHPSEQTLIRYEERMAEFERHKADIARKSNIAAETEDGVRLKVMGNIELPEEVVSVIDHGGDGIGLYRTEFQYLERPLFPSEDELFDKYKDVVEVMHPKPVTIRTLDINGDKAIISGSEYHENNPALGLRAIRYCLKHPKIFKTQLKAILRAAAYGNVRILLPLITDSSEIIEATRLIDEAAKQLEAEGAIFNRDLEIGIMVEVPSAIIMADVLAQEADFFSLGTNDLIQYSLAIDRGNEYVAYLYDPLHPAILRMLKHIANVAHAKKTKLNICGEMAGNPLYTPILLGLGFNELSMSPHSIPMVKNMIRSLQVDDCRCFVEEIVKMQLSSEIHQAILNRFGKHLAHQLIFLNDPGL